MKDVTVLVGRVLIALIFIGSGWGKIGGYAGTQQYMESMGVAGALLPLVILIELGGGLALVAGVLTRLAAVGLAVFCVVAALYFHMAWDDRIQYIMFMKNITIAGGLLVLAAYGAGAFSVDAWWSRRRGAPA